jgi:hypothetical protein
MLDLGTTSPVALKFKPSPRAAFLLGHVALGDATSDPQMWWEDHQMEFLHRSDTLRQGTKRWN